MPALDGLAELIASQNPYTTGQVEDMDIHILPPTGNAGMQQADQEASQIDMEMDGGYPGSWDFKGVPQKLNKV
ncbi:MAG TPA: hypothetical protein VE993_04780, partial [Stellaceae bacterium]|nr:hypothetical protein [Stellaceae bacterium]